jgi:anthranilate phosphoribosyltransferase
MGETKISELNDGTVHTYVFHHDSVGLQRSELDALLGGDAAMNAGIIRRVLKGEKNACRDIAVLNAGAALYVAGIGDSIAEGVRIAGDSIDSGKALRILEQLSQYTR